MAERGRKKRRSYRRNGSTKIVRPNRRQPPRLNYLPDNREDAEEGPQWIAASTPEIASRLDLPVRVGVSADRAVQTHIDAVKDYRPYLVNKYYKDLLNGLDVELSGHARVIEGFDLTPEQTGLLRETQATLETSARALAENVAEEIIGEIRSFYRYVGTNYRRKNHRRADLEFEWRRRLENFNRICLMVEDARGALLAIDHVRLLDGPPRKTSVLWRECSLADADANYVHRVEVIEESQQQSDPENPLGFPGNRPNLPEHFKYLSRVEEQIAGRRFRASKSISWDGTDNWASKQDQLDEAIDIVGMPRHLWHANTLRPPPTGVHQSDIEANLRYRSAIKILTEFSVDWTYYFRAIAANDIVWWVASSCWCRDPRLRSRSKVLPFLPRGKQAELLEVIQDAVENQYDLVIDKRSRDEGGTLCLNYAFEHFCHFESDVFFVQLSLRKEDVDDGTDETCIFGKHRFNMKQQDMWGPRIWMPARWSWAAQDGFSSSAKLTWPENFGPMQIKGRPAGNAILGQPTTETTGISKRATAIAFDEHAVVDTKRQGLGADLWGYCEAVTGCRISLSTPRTVVTTHYKLAKSGDETTVEGEYRKRVFRLHWTDNPLKSNKAFCQIGRSPEDDSKAYQHYLEYIHLFEKHGHEHPDVQKYCGQWRPATEEEKRKWFSPWYLDTCLRYLGDPRLRNKIATEIDGEAQAAGGHPFNVKKIDELETAGVPEPLSHGDFIWASEGKQIRLTTKYPAEYTQFYYLPEGGPVTVWEEPHHNGVYVICVDTGGGLGRDYSVIDVWRVDRWPFEQAAQFRSNSIKPAHFGRYQAAMCHWYSIGGSRKDRVFIIIESNSAGAPQIQVLIDLFQWPYSQMYFRQQDARDNLRLKVTSEPGFHTSRGNRCNVIQDAADIFDEGGFLVRSPHSLDNMKNIVMNEDTGLFECEPHSHDDCATTIWLIKPAIMQWNNGTFGCVRKETVEEVAERNRRPEKGSAKPVIDRMRRKLGCETEDGAWKRDEFLDMGEVGFGDEDNVEEIW